MTQTTSFWGRMSGSIFWLWGSSGAENNEGSEEKKAELSSEAVREVSSDLSTDEDSSQIPDNDHLTFDEEKSKITQDPEQPKSLNKKMEQDLGSLAIEAQVAANFPTDALLTTPDSMPKVTILLKQEKTEPKIDSKKEKHHSHRKRHRRKEYTKSDVEKIMQEVSRDFASQLEEMQKKITALEEQRGACSSTNSTAAGKTSISFRTNIPIDSIEIAYGYAMSLYMMLNEDKTKVKNLLSQYKLHNPVHQGSFRLYAELNDTEKKGVKSFIANKLCDYLREKPLFLDPQSNEIKDSSFLCLDSRNLEIWLTSDQYTEDMERYIKQFGLPRKEDLLDLTVNLCSLIVLYFGIQSGDIGACALQPIAGFRQGVPTLVLRNLNKEELEKFRTEETALRDRKQRLDLRKAVSIAQIEKYLANAEQKASRAKCFRMEEERKRRSQIKDENIPNPPAVLLPPPPLLSSSTKSPNAGGGRGAMLAQIKARKKE